MCSVLGELPAIPRAHMESLNQREHTSLPSMCEAVNIVQFLNQQASSQGADQSTLDVRFKCAESAHLAKLDFVSLSLVDVSALSIF